LRKYADWSATYPLKAPCPSFCKICDGSAAHHGGATDASSIPCCSSVVTTTLAATGYDSGLVTSGTYVSWRPRAIDARRSTGTVTSRTTNAAASPAVIGNPRSTLLTSPSWRPVGDCRAIVTPTMIGTSHRSASQIVRTSAGGTVLENGTNARKNRAAFGAITPRSRIGHAAAAAIIPQRNSLRLPVTRPNRLTTAQSSSDDRIFPTVRPMNAMIAWMNAIGLAQRARRRRLARPAPRRPDCMVLSSGRISCS
jgi:hypothetical protein